MQKILFCISFMLLSSCETLEGVQNTYAPMVRAPDLVPENLSLEQNQNFRQAVGESLELTSADYTSVNTFSGLIAKASPVTRANNKDILIGLLLDRSDTICNKYLGDITRSQRTWRSSFSILGLLFGTAGSVASPERSSKLLAALSGGMSGLSGKLDEGLLSNQAGHLIRAANMDLRQELRDELDTDLQPGGDLEDLPLPLVASRIRTYHSRCSIDDGLTRLNRSVAPQKQDTPASGDGS